MTEVYVVNNVVGEDWESECYDSAGTSTTQININASVLSDVSGAVEDNASAAERDALSNDFSSSSAACVTSEADKGTYVSDSKKVFVSNINYRTTQRILWSTLECFGKVQFCRLLVDKRGKSKGCAVVTYVSEQSAIAAVNVTGSDVIHLHNRTLHIRSYRRRQQPSNVDVSHTDNSPLQHGDVTAADDVTDDVTADVDRLNDDVMLRVFSLLSLRDRTRCQRVCRRWRVLASASWLQVKCLDFTGMLRPLCMLTDDVMSSVLSRALPSLQSIVFSVCCSAVTDKTLSLIGRQCVNLRSLVITGGANVSNNGLRSLADSCTQLTSVTLHDKNHRIGEKGLWWLFHRCKQLRYVNVDGCCLLKGQCLHVLTSAVETLSVSHCDRLQDVGVVKVSSNCPVLRHLNVSSCPLLTDHALHALTKLGELVSLDVSGLLPQVTSAGLMDIGQLHALQSLTLRDNRHLNDDVLVAISHGCTQLTCLDVSVGGLTADSVTDVGLLSIISRCHCLSSLTVSRLSALTDGVLVTLAAEGRLRSLTARRCEQFTDAGATSLLRGCRWLEWLDLTGCFHVSNASLQCAVDVIQDEVKVKVKDEDEDESASAGSDGRGGRLLTLCVGGTSVTDVDNMQLPRSRLTVSTCTPYDMWTDWQTDWDSDQSADDDDVAAAAAAAADDDESFLDNDDPLSAERWNLS